MLKKENIVYNESGQILDAYYPEGIINSIFIYFHGGGLEGGTKADALQFAEYLTDRGIAVVSSDYRMYPNAAFPDFIEDSADAVAWVTKNQESFKDCDNIFVCGSSAGGYISMMLCFDTKYLKSRNIAPDKIKGYIHDSGQPTSHFNVLREKGLDTRRVIVDEAAPMYFVGLEKEYPQMLFLVADNDMQNRYEQTLLMLSTLKHFNYDENKIKLKVIHGTHCAHVFAKNENEESIFGKIITDFILG